MSYFEVNGLQVRHKTSEGVKEVLNIEHIAIEKGTTYGIAAMPTGRNHKGLYHAGRRRYTYIQSA